MTDLQPRGSNLSRTRDRNKEVVRRIVEAFNTGNTDIIDELTHPDLVDHSPPPGVARGRPGIKDQIRQLHEGFPDLRFEIESLIAEGDMVFLRWRMVGTHKGRYFFGQEPTDRRVSHHGHEILRLKDGKIIEHRDSADPMVFMDKLGLLDERMLNIMRASGVRSYEEPE